MRADTAFLLYVFACSAVLNEGFPNDHLQKQEAIHNQHSETTQLNMKNNVSSGNSLLEDKSLHEPIKVEGSSTPNTKIFCSMCVCSSPFDEQCLPICCNSNSNNVAEISPPELMSSQKTLASRILNTPTVTKDVNQVLQQNVSHTRTDSKATNGHQAVDEIDQDHQLDSVRYNLGSNTDPKGAIDIQGDAKSHFETQPKTGRPHSENQLPSKPTVLNSDDVNSPDPVSSSVSHSFNVWIIVLVLSSAVLISVLFIFIKKWRRRKLRESFLTRGGYNEIRPSCLRDILDDHSD